MDREVWRVAVHGVAKCRTELSDWIEKVNWQVSNLACCCFMDVGRIQEIPESESRFHYSQHNKWYHICIGFLCLPGPGSEKRGVVTGSTRYLDIVHSEDLCCSWGTLSLWAPPLFFSTWHGESMPCWIYAMFPTRGWIHTLCSRSMESFFFFLSLFAYLQLDNNCFTMLC